MTSTRDELTAAARELTDRDHLWDRLHDHLEDDLAAIMREDKTKPKKQPTPPTPWNDTAANLISEIAAGARRHENQLTLLLFQNARYRGGSRRNTHDCIRRLPDLITAALDRHPAHPDLTPPEQPWEHQRARDAARDLTTWPVRCRDLLDELRPAEEPWQRAPRLITCAYCQRRLHLAPGWNQQPIHQVRLVCRRCPNTTGDHTPGTDREWNATAHLGRLIGDPAA